MDDIEKLVGLILDAKNFEEAVSNISKMTESQMRVLLVEVARDKFRVFDF